jgi:hypothetical protein
MCRFADLWCAPIILVGYSFGGLIPISLVVEAKRQYNQRMRNDVDLIMNKHYMGIKTTSFTIPWKFVIMPW